MTKQSLIALAIACLFSINMATAAEPKHTSTMYKWYDEQGNVHYTQTPPPEGARTEEISDNLSVIEHRENMPKPTGGSSDKQGATGTSKPATSKGFQDSSPRSAASTGGSN